MGADALIGEVVAAPTAEIPATRWKMEPADATLAYSARTDERTDEPPT